MPNLMFKTFAMRGFGHTKYTFDDEDWEPNQYQVSISLITSYALYYFLSVVIRDPQDQRRGIDQLYACHRCSWQSGQMHWCQRTRTWSPSPVHPTRQTPQVHSSYMQMVRFAIQVRRTYSLMKRKKG